MSQPPSPVERIREMFFVRCGEDIDAMIREAARADFATVEALAHRMVGAAGALEEDEIARLARDLMAGARRRDDSGVAGSLAALQDALRAHALSRPGAAP